MINITKKFQGFIKLKIKERINSFRMRKLQESEDEQDKDVKMSKGKQENLKIQLDGKFTQDEF